MRISDWSSDVCSSDLALAAPLTVDNPVHQTVRVKPANRHAPMALHGLGAAAAAARQGRQTIEPVDFGNGWTGASISGFATKGAFTGMVGPDTVAWDEAFASGQEGVFLDRPPHAGEQFEVTFRDTGPGVAGGFVSAVVITDARRYDFVLYSDTPLDRKSVVSGKSVSVRVDLGGRRIIKKKKPSHQDHSHIS